MAHIKEYRAWCNVKQRARERYLSMEHDYVLLSNFQAFLKEIGYAPSFTHTVERKDNTKGYIKDNIRWATFKEQARNRSDNVYITAFGQVKLLKDWAKEYKLSR